MHVALSNSTNTRTPATRHRVCCDDVGTRHHQSRAAEVLAGWVGVLAEDAGV